MRALVCHHLSPDRSGLRLEADWPEPPAPGPGQVTLAVQAVGLNFPDHLMLSGEYQFRPELPFIPGTEGCGTVIAAGPGAEGLLGQQMIIGARSGLMAERITLPTSALRPIPAGLTAPEAAAFTVGALTAWVGLMERGRLRAGERVLISGAGGGMGRAAVQLAVAAGAHVVALAGSPDRAALAASAGAHEVILNPSPPGGEGDSAQPSGVRASTLPTDIDLVFDPVGGPLAALLVRSLRRGGRYAIIGFTAGRPAPIPFNRLLLKEIELIGVRAGEQGRQDPAAGRRHIAAIDARAAALAPHIGLAVPLAEADRAFAAMAAGQVAGKAVILV